MFRDFQEGSKPREDRANLPLSANTDRANLPLSADTAQAMLPQAWSRGGPEIGAGGDNVDLRSGDNQAGGAEKMAPLSMMAKTMPYGNMAQRTTNYQWPQLTSPTKNPALPKHDMH